MALWTAAGRQSSRGHNEKLLPSRSTGVRYGICGLGFMSQWRRLPFFFALYGFSCTSPSLLHMLTCAMVEEAAVQDDDVDVWTRPCDHARQALALPQGMVTYGHCIQGIVMAALRSFAGRPLLHTDSPCPDDGMMPQAAARYCAACWVNFGPCYSSARCI